MKVKNTSKFNVNDFVRVISYGGMYSTYANAMQQMWGMSHNGFDVEANQYPNGLLGRNDIYGTPLIRGYDIYGTPKKIFNSDPNEYWFRKLWVIKSIALHENGFDVICQVKDVLGRSILMRADCLELVKHNPKNYTPEIIKIKKERN